MLKNLSLKLSFLKIWLSFIVLVSYSATLFHGFYHDVSIVHALVFHPIFIVGILSL